LILIELKGAPLMRQVIMWNVVTLDGYFEGAKSWDLDFHDYVWGDELEQFSLEQLASADTLLFGRVTYEGMASYWTTATDAVAGPMNSIAKVVFSRTLEHATWNNTRLVREPAEEEVARLKEQPGRDMLVFGSANLSATLMRHGLIDEYRLCLAPVVLGAGNPLFKPSSERTRMSLVDARPLKTGGLVLRYRPAPAA
jgi:dihydrofolate reductase